MADFDDMGAMDWIESARTSKKTQRAEQIKNGSTMDNSEYVLDVDNMTRNQLVDAITILRLELDRRDYVPIEPNGFVTFTFKYEGSAKTYRYVAVRVSDRWYTTGEKTGVVQGVTWERLFSWFALRGKVLDMYQLNPGTAVRLP